MKIMWAFDPFQTDKEQQQFAARILRSLSNSKDELIAIYVASNAEAELATAFSIPASKRYTTYPKKVMTAALKKLNLKKIKPEVLSEKSLSMTAVAKQITDYTKKKKTDLLLVATNNKKFLPRLIFGSFAESIIHLSNCDLFIFHQKRKHQHVFFMPMISPRRERLDSSALLRMQKNGMQSSLSSTFHCQKLE